jgi:hypothetical protein
MKETKEDLRLTPKQKDLVLGLCQTYVTGQYLYQSDRDNLMAILANGHSMIDISKELDITEYIKYTKGKE